MVQDVGLAESIWIASPHKKMLNSLLHRLPLTEWFRPKKSITAPKKKKKAAEAAKKSAKPGAAAQQGNAPPNKILFVTNLPEETTEQMLQLVFQPYELSTFQANLVCW